MHLYDTALITALFSASAKTAAADGLELPARWCGPSASNGQGDARGTSWLGAAAEAVMSSSIMASWSGVPGSAV